MGQLLITTVGGYKPTFTKVNTLSLLLILEGGGASLDPELSSWPSPVQAWHLGERASGCVPWEELPPWSPTRIPEHPSSNTARPASRCRPRSHTRLRVTRHHQAPWHKRRPELAQEYESLR